MSLLEAISPTARTVLKRDKIIKDIIERDDDPPMTRKPYRAWLEFLSADDLVEYHGIVKKCHPKTRRPAANNL